MDKTSSAISAESMDVVSAKRTMIGEAMKSCLLDSSVSEAKGKEVKEDKTELQRYYFVGKMEMLFSLVADNILTIEKAAEIAHMSIEDAEDMLNGWVVAHSM